MVIRLRVHRQNIKSKSSIGVLKSARVETKLLFDQVAPETTKGCKHLDIRQ